MELNDLIPAVFALLGTIVGGAISYLTQTRLETTKQKMLSEATTCAIVSEISATLEVCATREYESEIGSTIQKLKNHPNEKYPLSVVTLDNTFPVFQANISNVGLIDPRIRNDTCRFYMLMTAIICDVKEGQGMLATEGGDLQCFLQLETLFKEALNTGKDICETWSRIKNIS